MQAVILAGGRGSRLDPYTRVLPKSLFPIGQEPMAEILIKQLRRSGVTEIIMCLGYLAELMIAYFQDGSRFGLPIPLYDRKQTIRYRRATKKHWKFREAILSD